MQKYHDEPKQYKGYLKSALAWTYDTSRQRLSDFTTNASAGAAGSGGRGLTKSPPDSLTRNVPGYVDFIDSSGRWISSGSTPPSGAAFVRRWAIGSADPVGLDTLGEFNWSSQHLDDEVLRCRNGNGEGQTGRVGLRCVRLVGRR